jgi:predicted AAA+ superfamily ATPase
LNEAAREGPSPLFFLDEVQNVKSWAPQLKSLVDATSVRAVVTGSSALRIEIGRDSLAGRLTTIEAGVLSLKEIARFHGEDLGDPLLRENGPGALVDPAFWKGVAAHGLKHRPARDAAFQWFSDRGGYPLAHRAFHVPWEELADQLNESVVRRVIRHDLRFGTRGRKRDSALLEELFRLACRYAGQLLSVRTMVREVQRVLQTDVDPRRVRQYVRFLADTLLLRLIPPLELQLKKAGGNPKICLADHGLRASWLQERIPLSPEDLARAPDLTHLAAYVAENVVGTTLATVAGLDLAYLPERGGDPEVDFVLIIGTRRIPLEVKYRRRIDPLRDTEGLRAFLEKRENNAPFGVLVTQTDEGGVADPRVVSVPLSSLMLLL